MKSIVIFFVSLISSASAANFNLSANPRNFTVQKGSSQQVTVSQTTAGFSGMVNYSVFSISSGLSAAITTVGNTATLVVTAAATAPTGIEYVFFEGTSGGNSVFVFLTANVVAAPVAPLIPSATGAITMSSSVPSQSQTFDFTALGTADWFSMGQYGNTCLGGPCMMARKTGGTGLVGAYNSGGGDPWFYPYTPSFVNLTWSDSTAIPNNSAAHINNASMSLEAFAGVETRTLTILAGINGGGTLTTTLHLTDGSAPDVVDRQTFSGSGIRAYTVNFNAAGAGHHLVVTMSRSGGEMVLYGAALAGSPKPETHYLTLTDDLQGFLQTVQPGDTLILPDGYSRVGHLILPVRLATGYVDIKSNTTVAPGTRVMPGDLKVLLTSPDGYPAIQNDYNNPDHSQRPARGFRFTGIEITVNSSAINYSLINLGFGPNPSISEIPRDIVFDRCYIHGDGVSNYIRGVVGNANNLTISNSYLSGFVSSTYEANAINVYSSQGPVNIVNNYLESTGENIMIGGSGPDVGPVLVPTGGLIQHNYFNKLTSWRGGPFIVKNLLEFKDGYNYTIDSNVFENCWQAAQNGAAIVVTPRTAVSAGGTLANHVDTLTFTNNIIAHIGTGIVISQYDDLAVDANGKPVPPAQLPQVHDITLRNNLFDDMGLKYASFSHGMLIFGPPNNLVLDHNTLNFNEQTNDHGWYLANTTGETPSNASTTYNDFGADLYGDSRFAGTALFTGGTFVGNNIRYPSSHWNGTSYAANSTFLVTAPAGVGADVAGLQSREAAVKSGNR